MQGSKPGERRGGRQKGTPNKVPSNLKQMILGALDKAGGLDYLAARAIDTPGPFMQLVGKVLPTQVTGKDDGPVQVEMTVEAKREAARAILDAVFEGAGKAE